MVFINWFCILQLYLFISSASFFNGYLRIFYILDHVICKWRLIYSFFLVWLPLISFSCLIAWLEPPEPCWVAVILSMMLAVGFYRCPFSGWGSTIPGLLSVFYHEKLLDFYQMSFCVCWNNYGFCSLLIWFINWLIFKILSQTCISGINPTWL